MGYLGRDTEREGEGERERGLVEFRQGIFESSGNGEEDLFFV